MKFIYKAALLICSSVFAMSVQAAGMPQSSKHAQRGVNCTQCHTTGKFEPVETKQCQTCHNQDQLAQKNRPPQLHFTHEESEDRRSQRAPRPNQSS